MDERILIVSGITCSGKTSVAKELAESLDGCFLEGDDLHSEENVAKMKAGKELDDHDREPWLHSIVRTGLQIVAENPRQLLVVTCSALKASYRETLRVGFRAGGYEPGFLVLLVSKEEAERRSKSRKGHFMPSSLVESQLRDLDGQVGEKRVRQVDTERPFAETMELCRQIAVEMTGFSILDS